MSKLIAVSPVGKNGQTVVPLQIRKMFKIDTAHNLVGFYIEGNHIELAPVAIEKSDYSTAELDKIENLGKTQGRKFKTSKAAKTFLKSI